MEVASADGHPEVGIGLQRLQARRIVAAAGPGPEDEQRRIAHHQGRDAVPSRDAFDDCTGDG